MIVLRRFAVLLVLMFWQGGFVFYAAVVVPVAMSVLHPPSQQSFVTMIVTRYLNATGLIALLVVLAFELLPARELNRRWWIARRVSWSLMVAAGLALCWLHPRLMSYMDQERQVITDREALYPLHRVYLLVSAAQWLCATLFMVLTLRVWQEEDWRRKPEV